LRFPRTPSSVRIGVRPVPASGRAAAGPVSGASRFRLRALLASSLLASFLLAAFAAGCGGSARGVTSDEIHLGTFAPLTGEFQALSNVAKAMDAYFRWVNDQGGINGRNVRLSIRDDQGNPEMTPAAVEDLLSVRGDPVFAMVGGMGSGSCLAIKDRVANGLIPWINPGSSSPVWTDPVSAYVFSIFPTSITAAKVLAHYAMSELGARRIGALVEDTPFGGQGQEGYRLGVREFYADIAASLPEDIEVRYTRSNETRIRRPRTENPDSEGWVSDPTRLPQRNGALWRVERTRGGRWGRPERAPEDVGTLRSPRSGTAIAQSLAGLRDNQADAILIWGVAEFGAEVAKAVAADPDWNPQLLGSIAMSDPAMFELAGDAWDGAVVVSSTPDLVNDHSGADRVREILAQYAPDLPFGDYAVLGMAWAQLAHHGMELAGEDLQPITLIRALETLDHWHESFLGPPVSFSEDNHRGLDAVTVKRVEDGQFVALTDWLGEVAPEP